jgi:hypothetical protein
MRPIVLGLVIILFSSFSLKNEGNFSLKVNLEGDDFSKVSHQIYSSIDFGTDTLNQSVFNNALKGYCYLKSTDQLENDTFLTVVDFSKSSNTKRLWVIDMTSKTVIVNDLVAHGKYSGNEFPKYFSNTAQSRKSSLGFYVTGDIYNGKHRLSLKLRGKERYFNSNAFARGIVFHGADYVSQKYVTSNKRIGRSFGCPAVPQSVNRKLVNTIEGGSCVFLYFPSVRYLKQSKIINNSLYIPYDELMELLE